MGEHASIPGTRVWDWKKCQERALILSWVFLWHSVEAPSQFPPCCQLYPRLPCDPSGPADIFPGLLSILSSTHLWNCLHLSSQQVRTMERASSRQAQLCSQYGVGESNPQGSRKASGQKRNPALYQPEDPATGWGWHWPCGLFGPNGKRKTRATWACGYGLGMVGGGCCLKGEALYGWPWRVRVLLKPGSSAVF